MIAKPIFIIFEKLQRFKNRRFKNAVLFWFFVTVTCFLLKGNSQEELDAGNNRLC
jgi:hypothetical protein